MRHMKLEANGISVIRAVVPRIKKNVDMLLPTIFPIAISEFPFLATITEVTSSGREVPNATYPFIKKDFQCIPVFTVKML